MKPRRIDWYPVDWLDGVAAMPPDQRGVYDTIINLIYAHASDDASIDLPEAELAIRCCCHWRELRRILAALVDRGKVVQDGRKIYVRRCAEELQKSVTRVARASQNASKRWTVKDLVDANASQPSNARGRDNHQPSTINHQPSKETRASRAPSNEAFDRWYEGYPRKEAKGAARKVFPSALKKTSLEELIAGVKRYIANKPPDQAYCHPATWLNQERWLDVPATASNGAAQPGLSFHTGPKGPPPTLEGLEVRTERPH